MPIGCRMASVESTTRTIRAGRRPGFAVKERRGLYVRRGTHSQSLLIIIRLPHKSGRAGETIQSLQQCINGQYRG